jgi:PAS domain S-box-containing protein
VNKSFAEAVKSKPEDLIGKKCYEVLHKSDKPWPECPFQKTKKNKKCNIQEVDDLNIGTPLLVTTSPIFDHNGEFAGCVHIAKDISEFKKAEEIQEKALYDVNKRVKELNCFYDLSEIVEKPGILLEEIFERMVGIFPPAWKYPDITCAAINFEGKKYKTGNFKACKWKQSADIIVYGKKAGTVEVCYLEEKPEMHEGPFLEEERALLDAIAEQLGRIVERKQAEKETEETKVYLEGLISSMTDGLWVIDLEGKTTDVNQSMLKMLGCESKAEMIGRNPAEFTAKEDIGATARLVKESFSEKTATADLKLIKKDGKVFSVSLVAVPRKDGEGKIIGGLAIIRDITERKQVEDVLQESEKKYKTLFDSSRDAIMTLTPEKGFLGGNDAAIKMFGCKDEEEFTSKAPEDLSPEYQPDGTLSAIKSQQMMAIAIKEGSHFFEWTHKRIDGKCFFSTVSLTRMALKGKKILQATVRNITERKKAEKALEEAHRDLENKVKERTAELQEKLTELERFRTATVDREFRMKELQDEIEKLKAGKGK